MTEYLRFNIARNYKQALYISFFSCEEGYIAIKIIYESQLQPGLFEDRR